VLSLLTASRRCPEHDPAHATDFEDAVHRTLTPKHQRRLTGFDEKILALYAKGMTTRDIQDIVKELYDADV
jgi:putative transposase